MAWRNRKKAFIFAMFLAFSALWAPGLARVCQAAQMGSMTSHSCCEGKAHCGAQIKSEACCCKSAPTSSRHSIPVPQVSLDLAKFFPLLSFSYPSLSDGNNFSQLIRASVAVFTTAPPFLTHHAFLC